MNSGRPTSNDSNDNKHAKTPFPLFTLPKDIRDEIYSHFSLKECGLFAQTSRVAKCETKTRIEFLKLLVMAVDAEPESYEQKDETKLAVIALLKKQPDLLFKVGTINDHFGRKIKGSIYQLLLGAGDVWALKQVHEEIIPKIKDGEAEAQKQFEAQFPNCPWPLPENFSEEMLYDNRNKQQIEEIVKQLATVKQLMDADPFNNDKPLDATKLAIETLCKLFQPKANEVIRSGLHFPLSIIKEIYNTYNALQHHWSFFSLAVIKPALDALSTVDGQCCQYGLKDLDMKKGPSRRCHSSYQHPLGKPLSLRFVNDKDKRGVASIVDPFDGEVLFASSTPDLFDWFNKNGVARVWGLGVAARVLRGGAVYWTTYAKQKQRHMGVIMQPIEKKSTYRLGDHDQQMRYVIL